MTEGISFGNAQLMSIDQLLFTQKEVEDPGIRECIEWIQDKKPITPLYGRFCKHTGRYYIIDGHHKAYTLFFHFNVKQVECVFDDCAKPDTHPLDAIDPCIIREDFYLFNGTIYDLEVVNYEDMPEE